MSPMAAPHPCGQPGCPELVRGASRCPTHEKKRDRERGTAHQRGYDARWRKYRERYLAEHPLCVAHLAKGEVVPATVVHHRKPHKGDQALFWDPNNHEASCAPCHDAHVDEGDFGR